MLRLNTFEIFWDKHAVCCRRAPKKLFAAAQRSALRGIISRLSSSSSFTEILRLTLFTSDEGYEAVPLTPSSSSLLPVHIFHVHILFLK